MRKQRTPSTMTSGASRLGFPDQSCYKDKYVGKMYKKKRSACHTPSSLISGPSRLGFPDLGFYKEIYILKNG
jgi:hypothetical protein